MSSHRGITSYSPVILAPFSTWGLMHLALLPSTTTGLVESRSIMQPIRHILRYKKAAVQFYEADCTNVDPVNKTITITGITPPLSELGIFNRRCKRYQGRCYPNHYSVRLPRRRCRRAKFDFWNPGSRITCLFPQRSLGCNKDPHQNYGIDSGFLNLG